MKEVISLVFTALLALSGLQAAIWNEEPKSFNEGESYQFKYKSQVLSGLPKSSAQYTGLQLKCSVLLTFESNSRVSMLIKKPTLLETYESVVTRNPYNFVDGTKLKKNEKFVAEKAKSLLLPVSFIWNVNEKISDFKTTSNDNVLSENIKRGIVNMLNVKLKLKGDNWKDDGGSYYKSEDEGIDGICGANYLWSSYPYVIPGKDGDNVKTITLTRSKSANKCSKPIGTDVANFLPTITATKEKDTNRTFVKNVNGLSMNLTVWKSKKFFVWGAQSKSRYSIQPEEEMKESVTTFIVQSLAFEKAVKAMPSSDSKPTVSKSLIMDMEDIKKKLTEKCKTSIVSLVEKLTDPTGSALPKLLSLLRLANDQDISDITKKVLEIVKTKPDLLKQYLNTLSHVLTYSSAKTLVNDFVLKPMPHIDDDNEMGMRISPMAGLSNVAETNLIDLLTKAASTPVLLKHKHRFNTLKATWLTIASMAGTHYSYNPQYDIDSTIKYFTKIVPTLKSNLGKEETSIVILKALGNIGTPQIVPVLKEYLNKKEELLSLRVQAIYSLRKVPRKDSSIELLMLKIFNDVSEDVELRLAAGVDLCIRHTRKSTLNLLVSRVEREPINQVRSFMQDIIIQLAKIPKLQDKFRPQLRRITIKSYPWGYSRVNMMQMGNVLVSASAIFSPDSPNIVRSANVIFYQFRFGKTIIPLEFGFRFQTKNNAKRYQQDNLFNFIKNFIKIPESERLQDSAQMTVFVKRFDNEVSFLSLSNEVGKMFNVEKMGELMKFLNGEKNIGFSRFVNIIVNGKLQLPTTAGIKYSAQIQGHMELKLTMDCMKLIFPETKSSKMKMDIKPFWRNEVIFDAGIDVGYIKSLVNMKLSLVSPNPIWWTFYVSDEKDSFSIGLKKPEGKVHLLMHTMEKKFKTVYFENVTDVWPTKRFVDITPFYVSKSELKKMKNKIIPLPFGMIANSTYFCDAAKPRSDGIRKSWFSAGDAYASVWLKSMKKSDFDEFQLNLTKKIFHSTTKWVLAINHIKNQKVHFDVELVTFQMSFGLGNHITLKWPENLMQVMGAMVVPLTSSKKPELKYVTLSGSIQFPRPFQFDTRAPFKAWTHLAKYSHGFNGTAKNSKGATLYNVELRLGMGDEAKVLAEDIAKNPSLYGAHSDLLLQCSKDLELSIPNSPSCFEAWLKLNYYNQITASLNWTTEGLARFKKLYNVLNRRVRMSSYLVSEKFTNNTTQYKFQYQLLPYFHPASLVTTSIYSLTRVYKTIDTKRLDIVRNLFQTVSKKSISSDYKTCQFRKGLTNMMAFRSFDGYNTVVDTTKYTVKPGEILRMVLVQELNDTFQISKIKTEKSWMIQVVGKTFPVIRISKEMDKDKVDLSVGGENFEGGDIKWKGASVGSMNRIIDTIYSLDPLYEIIIPSIKVRILTSMLGMTDIEVSKDHQASVRGICGDMNGELYNEFINADCTIVYNSGNRMSKKSDYKTSFNSLKVDGPITQFMKLQKCSSSAKMILQ